MILVFIARTACFYCKDGLLFRCIFLYKMGLIGILLMSCLAEVDSLGR